MPTVAIDFDGTLAQYENGFQHPPMEPPTDGARVALMILKQRGYDIVIFSVRATEPAGVRAIRAWLERYDMAKYVTGITGIKPKAVAYIDDRAVPFRGNWLDCINQTDLLQAAEEAKGQKV